MTTETGKPFLIEGEGMDSAELKTLIHETVGEVLDQRNRVEAEKHAADHVFIDILRQKEQRKQEIWISVKKNVIGFLIISALTGIGTLTWQGYQATSQAKQVPSSKESPAESQGKDVLP